MHQPLSVVRHQPPSSRPLRWDLFFYATAYGLFIFSGGDEKNYSFCFPGSDDKEYWQEQIQDCIQNLTISKSYGPMSGDRDEVSVGDRIFHMSLDGMTNAQEFVQACIDEGLKQNPMPPK